MFYKHYNIPHAFTLVSWIRPLSTGSNIITSTGKGARLLWHSGMSIIVLSHDHSTARNLFRDCPYLRALMSSLVHSITRSNTSPFCLYCQASEGARRGRGDHPPSTSLGGSERRLQVRTHSKVKDPLPMKKQANVVYEVPCTCGKVYIGETRRRLETRLKVHKDACIKDKSSIAEHAWTEDHPIR